MATPAAKITPRSFVPLVGSMLAVFGLMLAQQTIIDSAATWRKQR